MKKIILITAVLVYLADFKAGAGNYYISQSGSGAANGADAADDYPLSWLNAPTNWRGGPGTIQPGDTVHLVGTLTNGITVGGSGTVSNYITIFFEPNASITQPAGSGINLQSYNCILIDGGTNGMIQNTANGSSLGNQKGVSGICGSPTIGNITIQNLTMTNLYVRSANTDESGGGSGVSIFSYSGATNIIIRNNLISQIQNGVFLGYYPGGVCANWQIYSNNISYVNWGVGVGDSGSGSLLNGLYIYANTINHFEAWDDVVGNHYHHNGIYTYAASGSAQIQNARIFGNFIGPSFGKSVLQTSAIFMSGNGSSKTSLLNWWCYNNIIEITNGGVAEGAITVSCCSNAVVACNTLYINSQLENGILVSGASVTNTCFADNLIIGFLGVPIANSPTWYLNNSNTFASDYNGFFPWDGSSLSEPFKFWTGSGVPLHDQHSFTASTPLTLTGVPSVDFSLTNSVFIAARSAGTNLSALFTTDYAGNTRTNAGNWDIGAYGFNVTVGSGGISGSGTSISIPTNSIPPVTNSIPTVTTNNVPADSGTNTVPVVSSTNSTPVAVTTASRPATPSGLHAVW